MLACICICVLKMFKDRGPLSQLHLFVMRTHFDLWVTEHPLLQGRVFSTSEQSRCTCVCMCVCARMSVCECKTSSGSTLVQATGSDMSE